MAKKRARKDVVKTQNVSISRDAREPMFVAKLAAHLMRAKILRPQGGLWRIGMFTKALDLLEMANLAIRNPKPRMPVTESGFNLNSIDLLHLAATLVEADILKRPRTTWSKDGSVILLQEDCEKLMNDSIQFVYECGDVLHRRDVYYRESASVHDLASWGREFQDENYRVPLEKVIERAGLALSTLNAKQLQSIGITSDWDSLSSGEKATAMFRFLTGMLIVAPNGLLTPSHVSKVLSVHRGPFKIGTKAELEEMTVSGVYFEHLSRVVEFLKLAKQEKERRQQKEAASLSKAARAAARFAKQVELGSQEGEQKN